MLFRAQKVCIFVTLPAQKAVTCAAPHRVGWVSVGPRPHDISRAGIMRNNRPRAARGMGDERRTERRQRNHARAISEQI